MSKITRHPAKLFDHRALTRDSSANRFGPVIFNDSSRIVGSVRGDEMRKELAAHCTARPRLKRDFDLFGPFMMGTGSRHAQKALKF